MARGIVAAFTDCARWEAGSGGKRGREREPIRREGWTQRALRTGCFEEAFVESPLDDFRGDGGSLAGDFPHPGPRNLTFIHEGADDAHEFLPKKG